MSEERPAPDDATPEATGAAGQPPAHAEAEPDRKPHQPHPTADAADTVDPGEAADPADAAPETPRTTVRPAAGAGRKTPEAAAQPVDDRAVDDRPVDDRPVGDRAVDDRPAGGEPEPESAPEAGATSAPVAPETPRTRQEPTPPHAVDDDAWATACAEDLAAETARRRARQGQPPGSAAEELRKLVDAVAERLSGFRSPLLGAVAGPAAQQVVRQVVEQAKAAVEPVLERNPDVFDHLAAAGGELLAAYRSAVQAQEKRWTDRPGRPADTLEDGWSDRRDGGEGTTSGEHIDLD